MGCSSLQSETILQDLVESSGGSGERFLLILSPHKVRFSTTVKNGITCIFFQSGSSCKKHYQHHVSLQTHMSVSQRWVCVKSLPRTCVSNFPGALHHVELWFRLIHQHCSHAYASMQPISFMISKLSGVILVATIACITKTFLRQTWHWPWKTQLPSLSIGFCYDFPQLRRRKPTHRS